MSTPVYPAEMISYMLYLPLNDFLIKFDIYLLLGNCQSLGIISHSFI